MEPMSDAQLEAAIRDYAGPNFDQPKIKHIDSIRFDEFEDIFALREALVVFSRKNHGTEIRKDTTEAENSEYLIGYTAHRLETPEELHERVDRMRRELTPRLEEKRRFRRYEFERLKQEFGD